jgi:hypothetical protein
MAGIGERAAYKEWVLDLSSKARAQPNSLGKPSLCKRTLLQMAAYFGCKLGLPPGLPGGGITGILPEFSGVGARIWGSMPDGGHSTPLDLASLSPSASFD